MSVESIAIAAILAGLIVIVALCIFTAHYVALGYRHRQFERVHGFQDTDEIPVGQIRSLEEFGPSRPVPPGDH